MRGFIVVLSLVWSVSVAAQVPHQPVEAPVPSAEAQPTGIGTSPGTLAEFKAYVDGDRQFSDLSAEVQELVGAVENVKAGQTSKAIGWAAVLAAVFKLLISLMKLATGIGFWGDRRGKTIIRLATLGLGGLVWVAGYLVAGSTWWEALIMALSGPGAIIIHEYSVLLPGLQKKPT